MGSPRVSYSPHIQNISLNLWAVVGQQRHLCFPAPTQGLRHTQEGCGTGRGSLRAWC